MNINFNKSMIFIVIFFYSALANKRFEADYRDKEPMYKSRNWKGGAKYPDKNLIFNILNRDESEENEDVDPKVREWNGIGRSRKDDRIHGALEWGESEEFAEKEEPIYGTRYPVRPDRHQKGYPGRHDWKRPDRYQIGYPSQGTRSPAKKMSGLQKGYVNPIFKNRNREDSEGSEKSDENEENEDIDPEVREWNGIGRSQKDDQIPGARDSGESEEDEQEEKPIYRTKLPGRLDRQKIGYSQGTRDWQKPIFKNRNREESKEKEESEGSDESEENVKVDPEERDSGESEEDEQEEKPIYRTKLPGRLDRQQKGYPSQGTRDWRNPMLKNRNPDGSKESEETEVTEESEENEKVDPEVREWNGISRYQKDDQIPGARDSGESEEDEDEKPNYRTQVWTRV